MRSYLSYPLNINQILRKKKSIKRLLLSEDNLIEKNIAILGGSTTSEIKNILELFLLNNGIKPSFYESEYNTYYEDALFSSTELCNFDPDVIYIHTTNKNITQFPDIGDDVKDIDLLLDNEIQRFQSIWQSLQKFECAIIQNNFDYPLTRTLGNLDCYDVHGHTNFINTLNQLISGHARDIKNLYINDINYLSSYIGLKYWFDQSLWHHSKYAISMESIPELAFNISKILTSVFGKAKKCLILDLDNTLWGGVIGDDGLNGIHIGTETAIAESYSFFQKYVSQLKNQGVTIAVCSKNERLNAEQGFSHPQSLLKVEDFTSFFADWNRKDLNVLGIAKDINIGTDSLVFIDDNPVERDIVFSQMPDVSVPNIGSDVVQFAIHIDRNGYFEPISLSNDDINRSQYYKDNKKRVVEQATFKSYDEFLLSLDMVALIQNFTPIYLDRITQLTNKTNQFNLTTKRYTLSEIETISFSDSHIKIYGRLRDKYGDNGVISIVIGLIEGSQCRIDLWLMSCRVLKRDMEFAMLDELVRKCKQNGVSELVGSYYESEKNHMVSNLYRNFGFELIMNDGPNTVWKLDLLNYQIKNKIIRVNNE